MNTQKLCVVIAAGAGALGTFLPWISISMGPISDSKSGIGVGSSDAWIILILFAIAFLISVSGSKTQPIVGGARITVVILGLIGAIIAFMDISNFKSKMGGFGGGGLFGGGISIGFGLYLIVIAGLLLPILAFAIKGGDDGSTGPPRRRSPFPTGKQESD